MTDTDLYIADLPETLTGMPAAAGDPTTKAVGEEGDGDPTTLALGEEGDDDPTTLAVGEEGDAY